MIESPVLAPAPDGESAGARMRRAAAHALGLDRSGAAIAWLVCAAMGLGLVMVYSTSAISAERDPRIADATFFLRRQAAAMVIALAALAVLSHCPLAWWRRLAVASPWLALAVLAAVLVPGIGHAANGARRWVRIAGIGFQPSDFARVGMVCFLALCAARAAEGSSRARWAALALAAAVVGLIAIEPNISTATTTLGVALVTIWLAGLFPLRTLALSGAVLVPVAALAAYTAFPHVQRRVALFVGGGGSGVRSAGGHQVEQGLIALGAGGPAGVGLGAGRQKLAFLPEESTDFILAEIGEELGFVGTAAVVILFALVCLHGFAVAARARSPFGAVLAAGMTVLLGSQAAANVVVVTGLAPTTGVPLPFISFGGSGTVALACAAAAIIAVARDGSSQQSTVESSVASSLAVEPPVVSTLDSELPTLNFPPAPPSEPAIELDRDAVIRESEFRALEDPTWLETENLVTQTIESAP